MAMLLCGCPEAATSEKQRVHQQLKALLEAATTQQAKSSDSHQRSKRGWVGAPSAHAPNPPPSQHRERGEGAGAAASVVKSRLGPNRDVRNTIEARRRPRALTTTATTAHAHDDHGRGQHHDSDDDRDRSWSLLTVKFRQPSHEFTFGVCMSSISYPLVLTPLVKQVRSCVSVLEFSVYAGF
jgi:hypothetical protein